MASYYGVIFPEFWTGRTGRELRERGGKDAQVLALYLMSNRHTNMLGLYRLQVPDIRHETGLGLKAIERGFDATAVSDFATFDAGTAFVWVHQMARFRLGLEPGETLARDDKRVKAAKRIYGALEPNPFLARFFDAYHRTLRLEAAREPQGVVVSFRFSSPSEGASEPLTSQGSEIRDQRSVTTDRSEPPRDERAATEPVNAAIQHFHDRFLERYHGKPTIAGAKDGARMKRLLKATSLEETVRRLDAFFDSPDPWVQQSGHTLDVFFAAGTQTKLVAQLSSGAAEAPFTPAELKHAKAVRDHRFGCQHEPHCASLQLCVEAIAREIRAKRGAA